MARPSVITASALMVWVPVATPLGSHLIWYGGYQSVPTSTSSTRNRTCSTNSTPSALAVALNVVGPVSVALLAGALSFENALLKVTGIVVEERP